jgi:hypothetical protein
MSEISVNTYQPEPVVDGVTITLTGNEARALSAYLNAESQDRVYVARKAAARISDSGVYGLGTKLKRALA